MKKPSYQDFLNELATGSQYGVFVDDTGSPGLPSKTSRLHPERKSWVGVVVPPSQMPEVLQQLPGALAELRRATGAAEFHFADIYAGRRHLKGIDMKIRLGLFAFMAEIFSVYQFPILVQTFDPITLANVRKRADFPEKLGPFNLTRQEDMALFFLLLRAKLYIERKRKDSKILARVFVDEGYKKNGTAIQIPFLEPVFADGLVCFGRSDSICPIQLADFAAFSLNRTQLIVNKEELTSLDKQLLRLLSPIAWNYQNIEKGVFDAEELEREHPGLPLIHRVKREK